MFNTVMAAPLVRARRSLLGLAVGDAFGETLFGEPRRIATRIARRQLEPRREEALWTAAGQHGDRDTLGAIVGGIVVLATGEDAIPARWRAAAEPIPDPLAD
jgi:ADP-ribosylglycohydrolase